MFKPFWSISETIYSWVEIFRYILNLEFKFEEVYFRRYRKREIEELRIEKVWKAEECRGGKEGNKLFVCFME